MKETPLIQKHREAGARIVEFAGYQMPLEYTGVVDEHLTVRKAAGLFDASHMGEFWVKGPNALPLLQYITTNNVAAIEPGKAQYSCMPNGRGGIVDDLIIYCYDSDKYMMVVNASNHQKDWDWINKQNNDFNAELEDASGHMSLLALQGLTADSILQNLVEADLSQLRSFQFSTETIEGVGEVIISRTGYTGAGGFELYAYNQGAPTLWDLLIDKGKALGLKPAGLAARDTLRLEMGYALYGNDIDEDTSPIEAGLQWIVKPKAKENYIDRNIHIDQISNGVARKLVGIELIERGIPRTGYELFIADELVGVITSGTMAPSLKKGIGMAYVQNGFAKVGTEIFVGIRNKKVRAVVVPLPFK